MAKPAGNPLDFRTFGAVRDMRAKFFAALAISDCKGHRLFSRTNKFIHRRAPGASPSAVSVEASSRRARNRTTFTLSYDARRT
jgi:hypothetical protein